MLGKLAKLFQRGEGPPALGVHVGVFGKHPGWDDHMDDLGLVTPRLVLVKRVMYSGGIAHNIDSGAWDKLGDEGRLVGFAHSFLWRWPGEAVVGRIWSSRDGKGRSKYPMLACVHASGVTCRDVCRLGLDELRLLESRCVAAKAAGAVRAAVQESEARLAGALASLSAGGAVERDPDPAGLAMIGRWAKDAGQGAARVIYQMEEQLASLAVSPKRSGVVSLEARGVRVPAVSRAEGESARAWEAAVLDRVGVSAALSLGVLAVESREGGFVDLWLGEPGPDQFRFLRAGPAREPLTSEIPYTLSPDVVAKATATLARWRSAV